MYKKKILLLSFVSILIFTLSACSAESRGNPTPTPVPQVEEYERSVYTTEVGPITEEQNLIGNIVPAKQDELFFRTSGFVTRMTVKNSTGLRR